MSDLGRALAARAALQFLGAIAVAALLGWICGACALKLLLG